MPEDFQNCTAEIHPALKVNRAMDGLELVSSLKEPMPAKYTKPQIYINDIYEEYKKSKDLKEALEMAVQTLIDGERDKIENKTDMSEVRLEERLSNQVYLYDKEQRKISLVTDTPNKRLGNRESKAKI